MPHIQSPRVQDLYPQLKLTVSPYKDLHKYRRFNNSIIHYHGSLFLMTYRLFHPSRTRTILETDEQTFHPWNSKWSSFVDVTVLAVLRWNGTQFMVLKEMLLHYPERLYKFDQQFDDSRIAKLNNNYYIYGQTWVTPEDEIAPDIIRQGSQKSNIVKCLTTQKNCDAALVVLAPLEKSELPNRALIKSISMPCVFRKEINKIHGGDTSIEKNWSFFNDSHGKIWFQYLIHPHMVISLDCQKLYTTPSPLEAIRKHYGCSLFFSPGGPLSRWKPGQMLGVGHLKYDYKCLTLLKDLHGLRLHPHYIYGLYFYIIEDRPPFRILEFSKGFVPRYKGQKYALVFPMGSVEIDKETWAVSMGNGDATPNVMILSRKDIESTLQKSIKPSDYSVTWWDVASS